LQANAPDAIYSAKRYGDDLKEHLAPMLAAEAGSDLEHKTPTEFASILNVGWIVLLTQLSELRVKLAGPEHFGSNRLDKLQGLLAKAVELSEAKRLWQSK
jgi:hypothetical protein